MRILIVDDEPSILRTLSLALESQGHDADRALSGEAALRAVERRSCDAALVDLRLGRQSGIDLMEEMRQRRPGLAVVIITAHASIATAIEATRRGAADYLPKPFTPDQLREVLDRVRPNSSPRQSAFDVSAAVQEEVPESELDTSDPAMTQLIEQARKVAPTDAAVLIRGESGTGKSVIARALHGWSKQGLGPFVTVACPSLSAELLESELFGHVHGAFTGAIRDSVGKVAVAERGTLFLDEVGDLPERLQPKLLRFLQERQYERVGESTTQRASVRVISATNHDLETSITRGQFREDLYYRLSSVQLTLPPLRERKDLLALADRLLAYFSSRAGRKIEGLSLEARQAIARYRWPGNVRELRNVIERAVILADDTRVSLAELPERLILEHPTTSGVIELGGPVSLEQLEREHIRRVLISANSMDDAAETLGIDRSTLYRKRRRLGL
jgi:two-component system, NtrC family, response regulator AlgB